MADFNDVALPGSKDVAPRQPLEVANSALGFEVVPGSEKELGTFHLGAIGNGRFKDEQGVALKDSGLDLEYMQSSAGFTGVRARARAGFKVAAFMIDDKTQQPIWVDSQRSDGFVDVASDRGNISRLNPADRWLQEQLGNQGWRGGMVRVTDARNGIRHYLVGGKFFGKADSWNVTPAFAEVELTDTPSVIATEQVKTIEPSE